MPTPAKRLARCYAKLARPLRKLRRRFGSVRRPVRLLLCSATVLLFILLLLSQRTRHTTKSPGPSLSRIDAARAKWVQENPAPGNTHELWDKVKNDVAFGVKTGHEVAAHRLATLRRSGWWSVGRDVPNILVVSDSDDADLGVLGLKTYAHDMLRADNETHPREMPAKWWDKTGWRGDKDKNLPALHLLRTTFPGKKWYLLLDDDTYIFLDNFARYILQQGMDEKPVYTGKVFFISRCGGFARDGTWAADKSKPKGMFAHGGSGIVLNAKAMEKVYSRLGECIHEYCSCWAGDMQVGLCMWRVGVPLRKIEGGRSKWERHFIPFWPSKALSDKRYSQRWHSHEEPITFHQIPENEQKLMSQFERTLAKDGDSVQYYELREHLMSNGILPFDSPKFRQFRYFSKEFFTDEMKMKMGRPER